MASDFNDRVAEIYVANGLLAEAGRSDGALGVAEIVAFLTRGDARLSDAQTRRLFGDLRLRESYRALKAQLAAFTMPAVAAASTGAVMLRRFDGGSIRLSLSRNGIHANLLMSFDRPGAYPGMLVLDSADGTIVKLAIPAPDSMGEALLILDVARDAAAIAAIQNPSSTGTFIVLGD